MLFSPLPALGLAHRVVMAPLTRVRGTETFACAPTAVTYYSERATRGGLLITEGSPVSPETQYEYAAGIYTAEQTSSWKSVVDAVHAKGGKISVQLWHLGRMCHASMAENAFLKSLGRPLPSVSASATRAPGSTRGVSGDKLPFTPARPLEAEEIRGRLVQDFVQAARNAMSAGFDFVEIHAAHGYLFDQFFCDTTNLRTDEFGPQTIENRTRALGLVLNAVIKEVGGPQRVGIRISPTYKDSFVYQGCQDSNPEKTYRDVISYLDRFKLAYLLISEPRWNGGRANNDVFSDPTFSMPVRCSWVKSIYHGPVIGSSSFTRDTAESALRSGIYDAIAWGRFFLANPDFVERLRHGKALNVYNTSTFYIRDPVKGYIDYPTLDRAAATGHKQVELNQIGSIKAKL